MSFTAKELDRFVENTGQEEIYDEATDSYVPNPAFNEDFEGGWMDIYYGEYNELTTPWGKLEKVKSWGGEGDGATIFLVVKLDDRLFQKTGYYSSWDSSSMDSPLVEVEEYVEPTTYYRKKS